MLIPLTRQTFEQLIPPIATGQQYAAVWGGWQDLLRRVLISVVGVVIFLILSVLVEGLAAGVILFLQIIVGLYWFWSPVYWASIKNGQYRRLKYCGFWRGRVLDVFISDEVIKAAESFNDRGELVIVENREKRINLELGDPTGFTTIVQAPLRRVHKLLNPGQIAECLVFSKQPDLGQIQKVSDVYIPSQDLWVGEYPAVRRDLFKSISEDLKRPPRRRPSRPPQSDFPSENLVRRPSRRPRQ